MVLVLCPGSNLGQDSYVKNCLKVPRADLKVVGKETKGYGE